MKSSAEHPAKMWPAIARHAVAAYSRPGDLVLDPMAGVGTTLVEAVELGRHAVGVEYEPQWAAVAATNLHLARERGHIDSTGTIINGDARALIEELPAELHGRVDLVVTSPPYGAETHGLLTAGSGHGGGKVAKTAHRYSRHRHDRAQLAHRPLAALLEGLADIFTGCHTVLRPGGIMVIAARPWTKRRSNGQLVDFPALVTDTAITAGFIPRERCAALLARWDGHRLVPHHTFFRLHNTRRARAAGRPAHLIIHEDILVVGRSA